MNQAVHIHEHDHEPAFTLCDWIWKHFYRQVKICSLHSSP